jgi:hypothetical protein
LRLQLLAWLACLVLVAGCGGSSYGASKGGSSLAPTPDTANATYSIEGRPITLTNGDADQPAAPGSASRNVTKLSSLVTSGDLDGDGIADLVVVLTNSPGGSGTFSYVASFLSTAKGATPIAVMVGDRVSIQSLAIKGGELSVNYLTRPDTAPLAATPSVPATKVFVASGGRLVAK